MRLSLTTLVALFSPSLLAGAVLGDTADRTLKVQPFDSKLPIDAEYSHNREERSPLAPRLYKRGGNDLEVLHEGFPGATATFTIKNNSPYKVTVYCKGKYAHFPSTGYKHYGRSWAKNHFSPRQSLRYKVPVNGGFYCSFKTDKYLTYVPTYNVETGGTTTTTTTEIREDGIYRGDKKYGLKKDDDPSKYDEWLSQWMKKKA